MNDLQIASARIEEYKKTLQQKDIEINQLEATIAGLVGQNEIYMKNMELFSKLIDAIKANNGF
jgi:cupin superfamily acireductone dioxygenase involved in methionine salvage